MHPSPVIASVIVTYGQTPELANLHSTLSRLGDVLIVDNKGDLLAPPEAHVLAPPANLGYGGAINYAVEHVPPAAEWLIFCNSDVTLDGDVKELAAALSDEDADVRYMPIIKNDRALSLLPRSSATAVTIVLGEKFALRVFPTLVVPKGSFVAVRLGPFRAVGGFDAEYFLYYEEIDLFERLRQAGAGFSPLQCGTFVVHHRGAASTKTAPPLVRELGHSGAIYARKHGRWAWAAVHALQLLVLLTRQAVRGHGRLSRLTAMQLASFSKSAAFGSPSPADGLYGSSLALRLRYGRLR